MYENYYDLLGIHPDSTTEEIRRAYKKMAFENHPDRNPWFPKEADDRMKKINNAYEILSDHNKKHHYDTYEYQNNKKHHSHSTDSETKWQNNSKTHHKKQTNTDSNQQTKWRLKPTFSLLIKKIFFIIIGVFILWWLIAIIWVITSAINEYRRQYSINEFITDWYSLAKYQIDDSEFIPIITHLVWLPDEKQAILVLKSNYYLKDHLLIKILDSDKRKWWAEIGSYKLKIDEMNSEQWELNLYDKTIGHLMTLKWWQIFFINTVFTYNNKTSYTAFTYKLGADKKLILVSQAKFADNPDTFEIIKAKEDGIYNTYQGTTEDSYCGRYYVGALSFDEEWKMLFKGIWTTKYTYNYWIQFDNFQKCVYAWDKQEMHTYIDDDLSKKYRVIWSEYSSLYWYDESIVEDVNLRRFPNLSANTLTVLKKWSTVKVYWVTKIWEENWYRVNDSVSWEYWWINQIGIETPQTEEELSWKQELVSTGIDNIWINPRPDQNIEYFGCWPGGNYSDVYEKCMCSYGYWKSADGKCYAVDCWSGGNYSDVYEKCMCSYGYWKLSDGKCYK